MYFMAISYGVEPNSFWDYTLAEVTSITKGVMVRDEIMWNHTSSMMALNANMNSKKKHKPQDFNPYYKKKVKSEMPKTKEEVLRIVEKNKYIYGKPSDSKRDSDSND